MIPQTTPTRNRTLTRHGRQVDFDGGEVLPLCSDTGGACTSVAKRKLEDLERLVATAVNAADHSTQQNTEPNPCIVSRPLSRIHANILRLKIKP